MQEIPYFFARITLRVAYVDNTEISLSYVNFFVNLPEGNNVHETN